MSFIIRQSPTRAYQRLPQPLPVINSIDDLLALQEKLECDIYITMPDEYNQRHVMFSDPL